MAFTEDLDLFLADFGVPISSGAVSGIGILDMPSEIVADGVVLTTDYKVTAKASLFGELSYGAVVSVDGTDYTVREVMKVDDGNFIEMMLMKIAPDGTIPGVQPRQWELNDLTDVIVTNPQQGDVLINDGTNWVNTPEIDGGGA